MRINILSFFSVSQRQFELREREMTSSVIEETMKRIQSHKGVEAILIVDNDGHVVESNLKERSEEHAALLCQLVRASFALVHEI